MCSRMLGRYLGQFHQCGRTDVGSYLTMLDENASTWMLGEGTNEITRLLGSN